MYIDCVYLGEPHVVHMIRNTLPGLSINRKCLHNPNFWQIAQSNRSPPPIDCKEISGSVEETQFLHLCQICQKVNGLQNRTFYIQHYKLSTTLLPANIVIGAQ